MQYTDKGLKKLTAIYKDGELNGIRTEYEGGVPFLAVIYKNGELDHARSREDMKKKLAEIEPPDQKITDEASERDAALRRLKAYRYICEVPYEKLTLDDEMNKFCLAGAQLCAKIGKIEHKPANPGLPEAEYKTAFTGTSKSNLAMGYTSLVRAVDGWMDDSDPSNLDRLGHRRWCINPRMLKTGFGRTGKYGAMYSQDQSQKAVPDFDFVAFPARGWMPVEYFNPRYAWSVSLHPQKYKITGDVEIRVCEIDLKLNKMSEPLKLNYNKPNTASFGLSNCLIFRPEKIERGKRYLVEIDGVKRPDGKDPGADPLHRRVL
jgi:Cysteine-rich secretory protein family